MTGTALSTKCTMGNLCASSIEIASFTEEADGMKAVQHVFDRAMRYIDACTI